MGDKRRTPTLIVSLVRIGGACVNLGRTTGATAFHLVDYPVKSTRSLNMSGIQQKKSKK